MLIGLSGAYLVCLLLALSLEGLSDVKRDTDSTYERRVLLPNGPKALTIFPFMP